MANRHTNKRLRMARTGESYQRARAAVVAEQPPIAAARTASKAAESVPGGMHAELIETTIAGRPTVLTLLHNPALGRVFVLQPNSLRGFRWQQYGSA